MGHYSNGSSQDLTSSATWSSSDISIAESYADLMGFAGFWDSWFIGWSPGTAQVSACVGTVCGSTNLTVIPWPPPPVLTSITVTPVNPSNYVGQTQQFTAMGTYTYNGSTFTEDMTSFATWSSTNTVVATIAAGGLATSVSAGATTITATYGGVSGSTTLTVQTPPPPPPPPVCAGGDVAYLMEFNFAGGAFNTPQFNYNGASASNSSLVPANGVLLGNVYASAPVFNSYSGGSGRHWRRYRADHAVERRYHQLLPVRLPAAAFLLARDPLIRLPGRSNLSGSSIEMWITQRAFVNESPLSDPHLLKRRVIWIRAGRVYSGNADRHRAARCTQLSHLHRLRPAPDGRSAARARLSARRAARHEYGGRSAVCGCGEAGVGRPPHRRGGPARWRAAQDARNRESPVRRTDCQPLRA